MNTNDKVIGLIRLGIKPESTAQERDAPYHSELLNRALAIFLQETHCTTPDHLVIPDFKLADWTMSRKHGLATFVHKGLGWTLADQSLDGSAVTWLCVDVDGVKIVSVYKPPTSRMTSSAIPMFPHHCLYAGDFNCQHVDWSYNTTSPDGESSVDWATKSNLALLHNPKDAPRFFSGRWNTGTNPDLAFASNGHVCWQLDRCILEKFPRPQHRPSLIKSSKTVVSLPSEPHRRWNFRKAKRKSTRASPTGLLGTFHVPTLPVLMRPTKTSAAPSFTLRKN